MGDKYKNTFNLGTFWNVSYPIFLSLALWSFLIFIVGFNCETDGLSDVLDSVINFSSIIIGFYTAMYGVMISLLKTDIFKIFKKNKIEKYFKFQLYDSLVTSFSILILSIVMQVLIKQHINEITVIIFNLWLLILGYFLGTSFRSISLLLKLMFNNTSKKETDKEDKEKKQKLEELKKKSPKKASHK
ncbi:hypothetical protein ACEU0I_05690 [Enterococcus faecalis]|uniref:hypothetical protein n=1 Tax=Enterococcus faecalis TaxID=1351 RepID=UPI0035A67C44